MAKMSSLPPRPPTVPPPGSLFPPGITQSSVLADDGTRLFVESKEQVGADAELELAAVAPVSTRAPGTLAALAASLSAAAASSSPVASLAPVAKSEDPRIFLCDGIMCDGFIWKYIWDDLAPIAPITHWHYRGHGRSAAPADPEKIGIDQHARDLARVRESVGDPPAILVGHSMGCQVVLEAYKQDPTNIKALILICGSFGKVTATFRGLPILDLVLPKLVDMVLKHEELARALWTRIPPEIVLKLALRAGDLDPEHIRSEDIMPYLKNMTHVDLPMFLKMLRAAGEHSAEDELAHIKVPVLVIAGERDTFTPAFLARAMGAAIPESELVVVDRGSHVVPIEQPEIVDGRIAEFLRSRVLG